MTSFKIQLEKEQQQQQQQTTYHRYDYFLLLQDVKLLSLFILCTARFVYMRLFLELIMHCTKSVFKNIGLKVLDSKSTGLILDLTCSVQQKLASVYLNLASVKIV